MIYLDNAATTHPKPIAVREKVMKAMSHYSANPGRSGHQLALETSAQVYKAREKAASFFRADGAENVSFTLNCTYALNMAIKGIAKQGGHVITTNLEHNAVMRPLKSLSEEGVITYDLATVYPDQDDLTVNSIKKLIKRNTNLIVCTHASNVFGIVVPIERISELAKNYGIKIVIDSAQSAGVLPLDLQAGGYDCICAPGHKGLYGPMGTGILACKDGENMKTIIQGGTGSMSAHLEQPNFMPDRFESGTVNVPGIIGLGAGIDFVTNKGIEKFFQHEMKLVLLIYEEMKKIENIVLYTHPKDNYRYAPLLSFNVKGIHSETVAAQLNEQGIAVRAGLHCAPSAHASFGTLETGTLRVAPSIFTTENEVNFFIKSIRKIAKQA